MIPWRPLSFGLDFTAHHFARYFLLRLLPFPAVRNAGAWLIARLVTLRMRRLCTTVSSEPVQRTLADLSRLGFASLPPLLSSKQIDEVLAYLATQPAYDGQRELVASPQTMRASRARYQVGTIVRCPHIVQAINNPHVLSIAEGFLGCRPTIAAIGLHWSYPSECQPADVQSFHRDTEAWRLLNMFVYLTDVDAGGGPHRYVLGSHRANGRLRLTPYADSHVNDRYGPDRVHTVIGPRGTTFVENGWGIHEGHPPSRSPRLILAVMYSVGPIPIYDYDKVRVTEPHLHDKYVNRLLFSA
jgi:hypothetical protein